MSHAVMLWFLAGIKPPKSLLLPGFTILPVVADGYGPQSINVLSPHGILDKPGHRNESKLEVYVTTTCNFGIYESYVEHYRLPRSWYVYFCGNSACL